MPITISKNNSSGIKYKGIDRLQKIFLISEERL